MLLYIYIWLYLQDGLGSACISVCACVGSDSGGCSGFPLSLQVLVLAVQSLVETVNSVCRQDSPVLSHFLSFLAPSESEWSRIRQALPPQVSLAVRVP